MNQFPSLERWFARRDVAKQHYRYTRYDLRIHSGLTDSDRESLVDEISLQIARLRLRPQEYQEWIKYWGNSRPIPQEWKDRFKDKFWKGFVSQTATDRAGGSIKSDEIALQGYLGELILYIVQFQYYKQRVLIVPEKPKWNSKDSGIDCLEICGDLSESRSLHYIVWEAKGLTSNKIGQYPSKIYGQHLHATHKSFGEIADTLAHRYEDDTILSAFIDEMNTDFYTRPPSRKKCLGACVTYSSQRFARSDAFSGFYNRFKDELAEDEICRQVRLCAVGSLAEITRQVWSKVWTKLLP